MSALLTVRLSAAVSHLIAVFQSRASTARRPCAKSGLRSVSTSMASGSMAGAAGPDATARAKASDTDERMIFRFMRVFLKEVDDNSVTGGLIRAMNKHGCTANYSRRGLAMPRVSWHDT